MAQESELALVEAAIGGDTDSFTKLCRRYYPAMVAIAHSVLGDRHFAEDAAQEAFAKAFCWLSKLKKKERFACWLATICRNVSRDMIRAKGRLSNPEDLTKVVTSSKDEDNELTEAVRKAVTSLSGSLPGPRLTDSHPCTTGRPVRRAACRRQRVHPITGGRRMFPII